MRSQYKVKRAKVNNTEKAVLAIFLMVIIMVLQQVTYIINHSHKAAYLTSLIN